MWNDFIVGNAARMAPDAGDDEIIILLGARERNLHLMANRLE
jgi:hypothetical protein